MKGLPADVRDIAESLADDPTLLLLTERHMRTETGKWLRESVAALGKRYFKASMAQGVAESDRDAAIKQADELRTLCDALTRRVQELEQRSGAL